MEGIDRERVSEKMMDKEKQEGMLSKKEGWGVIWKELLVRERERERESVCVSVKYTRTTTQIITMSAQPLATDKN